MVDFVGAQKTSRSRWNSEEVVARMQPYLLAAKQSGVRGFVDCTPAYDGRDPRILKKLAQNTGLHMRIQVTEITPAGTVSKKVFDFAGHEWTRSFTAEAR